MRPWLMALAALGLLVAGGSARAEDPPAPAAPAADPQAWKQEALRLAQRAAAARAKGDLAAALADHEALVRLGRENQPGSDQLATALNDLGVVLDETGRSAEALPFKEEALALRRRLYPGDHELVVSSLNNLGFTLRALGRVPETLGRVQEALAMTRRLYPGDHDRVAEGINNVAVTLTSLRRHAQALPLLEEALAMARRLSPSDRLATLQSLLNLSGVLSELGRHAEALPPGEEAVAMARRLYRGDHPLSATALDMLALTLAELGRAAEGLTRAQESLAMRRRIFRGDGPDLAKSLNNVGFALLSLGRAADALLPFEESLAMKRRLHAGDQPDIAAGLSNLGAALDALGRREEALANKQAALAMQRRLHPADHPDLLAALINVSFSYAMQAQWAQALRSAEDALAIQRRVHPGDHPVTAAILNNQGQALQGLGRTAEALRLQEEALAMKRRVLPEGHPEIARSVNNLAGAHEAMGHATQELALRTEAYALAQDLGAWERYAYGSNLGTLLGRTGRPQEAIAPLEASIAALEELRLGAAGLGSEERSGYMDALRGRSDPFESLLRIHLHLKDAPAALAVLERGRGRELLDVLARSQVDVLTEALRRARATGNADALARIEAVQAERGAAEIELARLGREIQRAGPDTPRDRIRALRAAERDARRRLLAAQTQAQQVVREVLPQTRVLAAADIRVLLAPDEWLLAYALGRADAHALLVGRDSIDVFALGSASAPVSLEQAAEEVAAYLDRLASSASADADELGRALARRIVPDALWRRLEGAARIYLMPHGPLGALPFETLVVGERDGKPVTWAEIGPPIAYTPSASVLAWLRSRPASAGPGAHLVAVGDPAFAGSAAAATWPAQGVVLTDVRPDGQAERLALRPGDVLVAYDGKAVASPPDLRAHVEAAGAGRSDIAVEVVREGDRLTVHAVSGPLGITIAMEPPPVAGPALLASGPVSGALRSAQERGRLLRPLPGTRKEVEAIVGALRERHGEALRAEVLLGHDATEARLSDVTRSPRILHLATHGLVDETETASFSSLALSLPQVPVPGDDGFLTLMDLFQRWQGRLEGTELVVLSACESVKGKAQRDESAYALPWGFLYAGSRAVLGSLWKVDDESTAFFMTEFYRRLLEDDGRDALGALAAARRATRAKYPHPYHWGAFVLSGAPTR